MSDANSLAFESFLKDLQAAESSLAPPSPELGSPVSPATSTSSLADSVVDAAGGRTRWGPLESWSADGARSSPFDPSSVSSPAPAYSLQDDFDTRSFSSMASSASSDATLSPAQTNLLDLLDLGFLADPMMTEADPVVFQGTDFTPTMRGVAPVHLFGQVPTAIPGRCPDLFRPIPDLQFENPSSPHSFTSVAALPPRQPFPAHEFSSSPMGIQQEIPMGWKNVAVGAEPFAMEGDNAYIESPPLASLSAPGSFVFASRSPPRPPAPPPPITYLQPPHHQHQQYAMSYPPPHSLRAAPPPRLRSLSAVPLLASRSAQRANPYPKWNLDRNPPPTSTLSPSSSPPRVSTSPTPTPSPTLSTRPLPPPEPPPPPPLPLPHPEPPAPPLRTKGQRGIRSMTEHPAHCRRCRAFMGTVLLFGPAGKVDAPYVIDMACAACAEVESPVVPTSQARRKRKKPEGRDVPLECECCKDIKGMGGVRAGGGEPGRGDWVVPDFGTEFVCAPCGAKYAFCSECGSGGKHRTGKYRPKELFLSRRTCSLFHSRAGDLASVRTRVYTASELANEPELEGLLEDIKAMYVNTSAISIAVPK
ncbi:hypothetical protein BDK51DRAFT_39378, partial [Blyttiomyces helicus]